VLRPLGPEYREHVVELQQPVYGHLRNLLAVLPGNLLQESHHILVKEENLPRAIRALERLGLEIEFEERR